MAILSLELEDKTPGRMLIRVQTVDDVIDRRTAGEQTFADIQAATAYLAHYLRRWQQGELTDDF